jgi:Na+-transporting NADH:ubiquinone oxidoreductase subunit A
MSVALLGEDYPGLRIHAEVAAGDLVRPGQVLFRDARRPGICFVAPIAGRVAALTLGPRRVFSSLVIDPDGQAPPDPAASPDTAGDARALLLASGLWPAFVTRPFGGPPDPDAHPDAIIVSAVPSSVCAPDPADVLHGRQAEFETGLEALTALTEPSDALVHLCLVTGSPIPVPGHARIRVHHRRAWGGWVTAGGQAARVHPMRPGGQVWTIGYQDVIAIGHLLGGGGVDPLRVVGLGTGQGATRRVTVPLGADLRALLAGGAAAPGGAHPRSGSQTHGRRATYLGRHHDEVGFAPPLMAQGGAGRQAIIPVSGLNRALPVDLPTVPLMRALSMGDAVACERLGCLDLLEEDVAPLTAMCTSGTDYGRRLRAVLDQIRKDAA